jgi:hypothetical protein
MSHGRGNSLLIVSYGHKRRESFGCAGFGLEAGRCRRGSKYYGVLAALQMLSEIFYWQGELEQADL